MKIKQKINLSIIILIFLSIDKIYSQTVGTKFNSADGKMIYTVTEIGTLNTVSVKKNGKPVGKINIPDTITNNSLTYSVTSIEASAFINCSGLDTITIGQNVQRIGDFAFWGCDSLTHIDYNATACKDLLYSANVFSDGLSNLCSVNIGSNVKRIPSHLFLGCTMVASVTFSDVSACSSIGDYAFSDCCNSAFTKMILPDSIKTIGQNAFSHSTCISSLTIGSGITTIGKDAFSDMNGLAIVYFNATNCTDLTEGAFYISNNSNSSNFNVLIGRNVTKIPSNLFYKCSTIRSLAFESSSNCTDIGSNAFYNATGLTTVALASSIKSIGNKAFYSCTGLSSIDIPNCVSSIGDQAFYLCTGLTSIFIPDSLSILGTAAFAKSSSSFIVNDTNPFFTVVDGVLFDKEITELKQYVVNRVGHYDIPVSVKNIGPFAFAGCKDLSSITIPNGVTTIGSFAFDGCNGLTTISIPNSVTKIEKGTFEYCTGLISFNIPEGITDIGEMAFSNCNGLNSIVLSNTVESIGKSCFENCTSLSQISIPQSVISIGDNAFCNCSNLATIVMQNPIPPTLSSSYVFSSIKSRAKLYVPIGSKSAYSPAYDSYFDSGSNIVETSGFLTDNGIKYIISDSIGHNLTVIENIPAYSGQITIPAKIYYNSEWYSVKDIGNDAFNDCSRLIGVSIPNSVLSIGNYAFYNCVGLTSIEIPDSVLSIGVNAYQNCTNLNNVIIGKSLKSVNDYAFQACTGLTAITFNNALENIGAYVFQKCTNLKSCTLGNSVKKIKSYSFQACNSLTSINIPDSTVNIESYAFSDCSSLESILWGNKLTTIGPYAFQNCTKLTSLTIPESMISIGDNAFMNCTGLLSVNFNAINCTYMGSKTLVSNVAFKNCNAIVSVNVGDRVTQIPNNAFYKCAALTSLKGCRSVTSIGEFAFGGCGKLELNAIPDSVITIDRNAFAGCTGITSIALGKNIKSIGISAFSSCTNMISVAFNAKNCTFMGDNNFPVFGYCTSFSKLMIGDSVTFLPYYAFYNCAKLTSITMQSSIPPALGSSVFTNIPSTAKLYVQLGSKANYLNYNNNFTYTSFFSSTGSSTDGARIIELITDLDNINSLNFDVFCNENQQIIIKSAKEICGSISVYNSAGQLQATCSLKGRCTTIPKNLAPNVYIVVVQVGSTIRKEKIIVI